LALREGMAVQIFVCASPDETGKFGAVVQAVAGAWQGSVLDVGCRSGGFKRALPKGRMRYCGLDLSPPAHVVGKLDAGLPFQNASSDTVVALDVLEHTDDIYASFAELCRVARTHVLVVLPNLYEIGYRLKFLMGRRPSAKYGLPLEPPDDRHRWLFSFRDAKRFTHALGQQHGFQVKTEGCLVGPRRGVVGCRSIVRLYPNLLSPWYLALLERDQRGGA
jgi:SAM-dependent methyltransferase